MLKLPVVTILGHIDHGKTSLLRAIRNLRFTEEKPGGEITQHLGVFEVEVEGKKITFLDTPGHEAFSQMRKRGAKVADLAVLVVDALEGPKEQTKEAIGAIFEAKIPFLVCATKIDKPGANPEMVKRQLQKFGVLVEDLGGNIPFVETSAKTGKGIDTLLDLILLLAEMEKLEVDATKRAQAVVVESFLDPKRGNCVSLIVEEGTLKEGDFVATESAFGKARILENVSGEKISKAVPGQGCLLIGFENLPIVGERVFSFETLEEAKNFVRKEKVKKEIAFEEGEEKKTLNLILKSDVFGTLEAIAEILEGIKDEKVKVRILKKEVGEIVISDVELAKAAKAKILGFRTKANAFAQKKIEEGKIPVFTFSVIYDLVEFVKKQIEKLKEPEVTIKELARLKVLVDFWKEKNRQIVGARVLEGEVQKGKRLKVLREEVEIGQGKILNLQKQKKDIEKAKKGEEIGILFEGDPKIEVGDILVCFDIIKSGD